ncbi:MAG: PAS domain S-box protein [Methylomonas sp.]|jgi:PAS domain S-box-containing protein
MPSNQLLTDAETKLAEDLNTNALAIDGSSKDKLLHELQVHQMELEMQNEELRQAKILLEASRDNYRDRFLDLYDYAPVGYLTIGSDGLITEINLTAATMLGIERKNLILHRFSQCFAEKNRGEWRRQFLQLMRNSEKQSYELTMQRGDGSTFDARLECCADTANEQTPSARIALIDITERKCNERLLLKSQRNYAGIIESAMDGIITIDTDQRILLFNAAAEKMLGCPGHEAIGGSLERFIPERFRRAHGVHIHAFDRSSGISRKMNFLGPVTALRANGEEFPVEISISKIDVEGEKTFIAILRDITERTNLEQERQKFVSLANNSMEFVGMCDMNFTPFYVNEAGLRLVGLDNLTQCIATPVQEFFFPEDQSFILDEFFPRVLREGQADVEIRFRHFKSGAAIWMLYNVFFIKDGAGKQIGLATVSRDISASKQAKEALREADRRKDEFLAMLAHELRNPLAPIRNAVEIQKKSNPDLSRINWSTEIIDRQIKQLTGLIDDLLDVSRISRGLIELNNEPLEIRDFIRLAAETNQPLIDDKRQKFTMMLPAEPLWVEGDRIRLTQIFSNLINNAAKYTQEGGRIELSVELSGDDVRLRVSDNGCGIDPADLTNLFDMFYQANRSLDRAQGGLGIGLSLVHKLVVKHGGEVRAYSAGLGRGSEFVVRLPRLNAPETATVSAKALSAPILNNYRILVVDDNRDIAESLAVLLKIDGYQVHTADNGYTALEMARAERPDAIILDIGLPGMNGYSLARAFRQSSEFKQTLLIAMTGYGQTEDREKSRAAGIDEHLIKPVDIETLRKLLVERQRSGTSVK